jgi:hypothetical protein
VSIDDVPSSETPESDRLESLLRGDRLPETEDDMALAHLIGALRAPGTPEELAGASAAVGPLADEAVRAGAVVVDMTSRRRPAALAATAMSAAVASVLLVGAAAAAVTGTLPAPLQSVAHRLVGAPAPAGEGEGSGGTTASSSSRGPRADPTSPAVVGLCRAFGDRQASATATGSTAYRALAAAAKAHGQSVADYCAGVLATVDAAPSTTPGLSHRPTTPPGQTHRPTTPPGLTHRPTTPPGQSGQSGKPTPPGQTHRPTTPPGQTHRPTAAPGSTRSPNPHST